MYRSVVLFTISLLITVVALMPANTIDIEPEISTDLFNSDANNALELFSLPNLTAIPAVELDRNLRYTFGKRVKHDRLVSQNNDKSYWPSPQNVTFILQYPFPGSGNGAIVTFVEIIVNQSSNIGAARVIAGGIGKRSFASIVQSNRTYWFNYSANIYGI